MIIPHNKPTLGEEEASVAREVICSGFVAPGKETYLFENELCDYLGYDSDHAVALSSGSAALYMALRAVIDNNNTSRGIVIPAYSCSALKNAVNLAGATPSYVDVEKNSPNIDLNSEKICSADIVIAAHMYGSPLRIENKRIIEDCAQAIGAEVDGKKAGTQTDISVFSFYATKPITSGGEGGVVVSKDIAVIDYIKDLRDFDMKNDNTIRFNFKMTDIQAAIGRVQLRKLDSFIEQRRYLADRYENKGIKLWGRKPGNIDYRGLVKSKDPLKLIDYLKENGINSIVPIEYSELLCDSSFVPNAYNLTQSLVSIPLYPLLSDKEQDYIVNKILEFADKEGDL